MNKAPEKWFPCLNTSQMRHHSAAAHLWSSNCHGDVNIVTVDDLSAFNDCIDSRLVLQCKCRRLDKWWHKAELHSVLLHECIFELVSHFHSITAHNHQPQTLLATDYNHFACAIHDTCYSMRLGKVETYHTAQSTWFFHSPAYAKQSS